MLIYIQQLATAEVSNTCIHTHTSCYTTTTNTYMQLKYTPTNIIYTHIPAVTQQQLIHTYTHAAEVY